MSIVTVKHVSAFEFGRGVALAMDAHSSVRKVFSVGQHLQPMDQPEKAGRVVDIKWDEPRDTYLVKLSSSSTWYDQDEIEGAG